MLKALRSCLRSVLAFNPPGYNVQCIPKIDEVWPTWTEEKARLTLMDEHPKMPVIGKSAVRELDGGVRL